MLYTIRNAISNWFAMRDITDAERYCLDGMPTVCRCGGALAVRVMKRGTLNVFRVYCPAELSWWEKKDHDYYEWGGG